ncbi:MAG: hypothetical protein IIC67_00620 [Thaumarchaeota archaeon]|nr:hypothetical protein [Nitrososphaerota archaeon]
MDENGFRTLSSQFKILEQIGYDEYQIKIWIMAHMDIQDRIDIEGFGKFSCKSFMKKGKSYNYLIGQVKDLVNRKVLLIVDRHASLQVYRFSGEAQYEFQKLLLAATDQFRNRGSSELANMFRRCLEEEKETSFISTNVMTFFEKTKKDPEEIKKFLTKFLIANASAYGLFILALLL